MKYRRNSGFRRAGFSLVELMVAVALGAILLLAVTEIATRNSATRNELQRSAAQIENGVFAIQQLEQDIANAAFWGETGEQTVDPAGPPPVLPGTTGTAADDVVELRRALGYPVHGGQAPLAPSGLPTGEKVKSGTDYLALRRASSCALGDPGCDMHIPGDVYLQANACFQPNVAGAPAPGDLQLSNDLSDLDYRTRACDPTVPAPRYRLLSRIYFVNDRDQLVRGELSGAGKGASYTVEAIVDGIETMRLEYGLDNGAVAGSLRGDGQVDEYDLAPVGVEWSDVVAVRVSLVVRSRESSPGYVDDRSYTVARESYTVPAGFVDHKRQVFSRTIPLRNVAERRE